MFGPQKGGFQLSEGDIQSTKELRQQKKVIKGWPSGPGGGGSPAGTEAEAAPAAALVRAMAGARWRHAVLCAGAAPPEGHVQAAAVRAP